MSVVSPLPIEKHQSYGNLLSHLNNLKAARLPNGDQQFLFRGEARLHPNAEGRATVRSTFHRLQSDATLVGQAFTIYRRAQQIVGASAGYSVSHEDAIAVLRHYELPTPSIDVTGTPEVALSFALGSTSDGVSNERFVFVIDCAKLPNGGGKQDEEPFVVTVEDHFFLTQPINDGGLTSRWMRQDGFALMPSWWRAAVPAFDMLDDRMLGALSLHSFPADTCPGLPMPDLMSKANDQVAARVGAAVRAFVEAQGWQVHPYFAKLVMQI
ncbi:FRG domain-containing protein [Roseateles sp. DXS20W]|uniref:FRG domain-containing protein n=1 Tax=Pelomonas lactea TaxID=3299030 RepID=A0ABW7GQ00_9BURK